MLNIQLFVHIDLQMDIDIDMDKDMDMSNLPYFVKYYLQMLMYSENSLD